MFRFLVLFCAVFAINSANAMKKEDVAPGSTDFGYEDVVYKSPSGKMRQVSLKGFSFLNHLKDLATYRRDYCETAIQVIDNEKIDIETRFAFAKYFTPNVFDPKEDYLGHSKNHDEKIIHTLEAQKAGFSIIAMNFLAASSAYWRFISDTLEVLSEEDLANENVVEFLLANLGIYSNDMTQVKRHAQESYSEDKQYIQDFLFDEQLSIMSSVAALATLLKLRQVEPVSPTTVFMLKNLAGDPRVTFARSLTLLGIDRYLTDLKETEKPSLEESKAAFKSRKLPPVEEVDSRIRSRDSLKGVRGDLSFYTFVFKMPAFIKSLAEKFKLSIKKVREIVQGTKVTKSDVMSGKGLVQIFQRQALNYAVEFRKSYLSNMSPAPSRQKPKQKKVVKEKVVAEPVKAAPLPTPVKKKKKSKTGRKKKNALKKAAKRAEKAAAQKALPTPLPKRAPGLDHPYKEHLTYLYLLAHGSHSDVKSISFDDMKTQLGKHGWGFFEKARSLGLKPPSWFADHGLGRGVMGIHRSHAPKKSPMEPYILPHLRYQIALKGLDLAYFMKYGIDLAFAAGKKKAK